MSQELHGGDSDQENVQFNVKDEPGGQELDVNPGLYTCQVTLRKFQFPHQKNRPSYFLSLTLIGFHCQPWQTLPTSPGWCKDKSSGERVLILLERRSLGVGIP